MQAKSCRLAQQQLRRLAGQLLARQQQVAL
jgi:hypothetical protein